MNSSHTPACAAAASDGVARPRVEIADHRDALGIGRPHGEAHAARRRRPSSVWRRDSAELAVAALVEQIQVEIAEQERRRNTGSSVSCTRRASGSADDRDPLGDHTPEKSVGVTGPIARARCRHGAKPGPRLLPAETHA